MHHPERRTDFHQYHNSQTAAHDAAPDTDCAALLNLLFGMGRGGGGGGDGGGSLLL